MTHTVSRILRAGAAALAAAALALPLSCDVQETPASRHPAEMTLSPLSHATKGYVTGAELVDTPYSGASGIHGTPVTTPRDIVLSSWVRVQDDLFGEAYFTGETFTRGGEGAAARWRHDPAYYWPIGSTCDFLAYSCSAAPGIPASKVRWGSGVNTGRLAVEVGAAHSQDDILYAYAGGVTSATDNGDVNMTFRHAQAWLAFEVKASAENLVTLVDIQVQGLHRGGVMEVVHDATDTYLFWNFDDFPASDASVDDNAGVYGTALGVAAKYLDQLVPKQEQRSFVISYRLAGSDRVFKYRYAIPSGSMWNAGVKYTYVITLSPHEITVDPTVTAWDVQAAVAIPEP